MALGHGHPGVEVSLVERLAPGVRIQEARAVVEAVVGLLDHHVGVRLDPARRSRGVGVNVNLQHSVRILRSDPLGDLVHRPQQDVRACGRVSVVERLAVLTLAPGVTIILRHVNEQHVRILRHRLCALHRILGQPVQDLRARQTELRVRDALAVDLGEPLRMVVEVVVGRDDVLPVVARADLRARAAALLHEIIIALRVNGPHPEVHVILDCPVLHGGVPLDVLSSPAADGVAPPKGWLVSHTHPLDLNVREAGRDLPNLARPVPAIAEALEEGVCRVDDAPRPSAGDHEVVIAGAIDDALAAHLQFPPRRGFSHLGQLADEGDHNGVIPECSRSLLDAQLRSG